MNPVITAIMTKDDAGSELVKFANETADQLVKENLTRNQIRNAFTEVRQIEAMWDRDQTRALRRLNMLKPKLAYQAVRTPAMGRLTTILSDAVTEVTTAKDQNAAFERFMQLFEAILAYHRALGGKN